MARGTCQGGYVKEEKSSGACQGEQGKGGKTRGTCQVKSGMYDWNEDMSRKTRNDDS